MSWVWEHSRSKLSARLVLLAIADHANGDGLDAYPSTTQLMRKTGLSERGVQKAIAELVELGELLVTTGGGRGKTNRYRVLMVERIAEDVNPADDAPFAEENPAQETPYSENPAQETPYSAPETPHNATENPAKFAPGTKREPRATVKHSPSGSAARTRGTRIPADFSITAEMRAWAIGEAAKATQQPPSPDTFPDWLDRHTERFRDHWVGVSGQRAVKVDWPATWRNWIRTEIDKVAQQPTRPGSALARYDPQTRRSTTDDRVAQGLALAAQLEAEADPTQEAR